MDSVAVYSSHSNLVPRNGTGSTFTIQSGGETRTVSHGVTLPASQWVFVAVSLSGNTATLYSSGLDSGGNFGCKSGRR